MTDEEYAEIAQEEEMFWSLGIAEGLYSALSPAKHAALAALAGRDLFTAADLDYFLPRLEAEAKRRSLDVPDHIPNPLTGA